ncbi:hypothetical protein SDC9_74249 [bioreactor metagenome]|uniref:Uncharacterized protein n=1 Tax=bioreactor metagenome TaxID=1076179 RepID=A0A644YGW3_9ZZZZ
MTAPGKAAAADIGCKLTKAAFKLVFIDRFKPLDGEVSVAGRVGNKPSRVGKELNMAGCVPTAVKPVGKFPDRCRRVRKQIIQYAGLTNARLARKGAQVALNKFLQTV